MPSLTSDRLDGPAILRFVITRPRRKGVNLQISFDQSGGFFVEIFAKTSPIYVGRSREHTAAELGAILDRLEAEACEGSPTLETSEVLRLCASTN